MSGDYWRGRSDIAGRMARETTSAEARLIHYELAGLYSARADRAIRATTEGLE